METLKFRIWNGDEMIYYRITPKPGKFYVTTEDSNLDASKYHYEMPIMLFSGIYDKKGKGIYAGDTFKIGARKEVFEVRFEHGCFMGFLNGKQFGLIGELQICFIDVIGNIYQNY